MRYLTSFPSIFLASVFWSIAPEGQAQEIEIERNPAEIKLGQPGTRTLELADPQSPGSDSTPLGVNFSAVRVIVANAPGRKAPHGPTPRAGAIDISQAGPAAGDRKLIAAIAPYIGQPISLKALSRLQRSIIDYYRDRGLSLVSVTFPPQDITEGIIRVDVVNYRLGKKTVTGPRRASDTHLLGSLRAERGDVIDFQQMIADIDWLRLNPYRNVLGRFSPGAQFGTTNLELAVKEGRPWSGFVELNNAGAKTTYHQRISAGFHSVGLTGPDHHLAYRFTAAPQALRHGRLWSLKGQKGYVSHALSYFIPLDINGFRSKVTLAASHVDRVGAEDSRPFTYHGRQVDFSGELATPFYGRTQENRFVKWDSLLELAYAKHDSDRFFGAVPLDSTTEETWLLSTGVRGESGRQKHRDWLVEASLGYGFWKENGKHRDFGLLRLSGERVFHFANGMELGVSGQAQLSTTRRLPAAMKFSLGGVNSLRSYEIGDATGPSGAMLSLELRSPPFALPQMGNTLGKAQLFGFIDTGYTSASATGPAQRPLSVGLGLNGRVEAVQFSADIAHSLRAVGRTKQNDTTAHFSLRVNF